MTGFLKLHIRRSVRLFAATGLVFAANLALDWTPRAPWTPGVKVLAIASAWEPTAPLMQVVTEGAVSMIREIRGWWY